MCIYIYIYIYICLFEGRLAQLEDEDAGLARPGAGQGLLAIIHYNIS